MRLAIYYQSLIDSGEVSKRAELARFPGVSGARVTQVLKGLRDHYPESRSVSSSPHWSMMRPWFKPRFSKSFHGCINVDRLLRLDACSFAVGEPGNEVAEFFAR